MPRGNPLGNFLSAVTAPVLIILAALVLVVLIDPIPILVLVLAVLDSILVVIHFEFLRFVLYGITAILLCPKIQDLSFALNKSPANNPATIAAVIPPAVAFKPPVKMPINPFSLMASFTPFARV